MTNKSRLALTLQEGRSLILGDDPETSIIITYVKDRGRNAKICIEAPRSVSITRDNIKKSPEVA